MDNPQNPGAPNNFTPINIAKVARKKSKGPFLFFLIAFLLVIALGLGVGLILVEQPQIFEPRANPASTPTAQPTNIPIEAEATAAPTEIVVNQVSPTEEETAPTVPAAGTSTGVYFMVIAGIVLITLLLVF